MLRSEIRLDVGGTSSAESEGVKMVADELSEAGRAEGEVRCARKGWSDST